MPMIEQELFANGAPITGEEQKTEVLNQAFEQIRDNQDIVVISGAGLSKASGIEVFYGDDGMYDLETINALSEPVWGVNPGEVWRTYARLYIQTSSDGQLVKPNISHRAIMMLEKRFAVPIITQNVDGLHQAAGSTDVIEIHGNSNTAACIECLAEYQISIPMLQVALEAPPRCEQADCGNILKPQVVLFGGELPPKAAERAKEALERPSTVMVIGTQAVMQHIQAPVQRARSMDALTIEVNPSETVLSRVVDVSIRANAEDMVPLISAQLLSGS